MGLQPQTGVDESTRGPGSLPMGTIVFVHANGFPAGVYSTLFEVWRAAGYAVLAPQRLGHDPAFPVVSNW
jgi:pimeloyl-ACP methyl ester carboxylesterase